MSNKKITKVACSINDGEWFAMSYAAEEGCWAAALDFNNDDEVNIQVMATDETGRPGIHAITYSSNPKQINSTNCKAGSDDYRIGPWSQNHVLGTRLGPNRNAKPIK